MQTLRNIPGSDFVMSAPFSRTGLPHPAGITTAWSSFVADDFSFYLMGTMATSWMIAIGLPTMAVEVVAEWFPGIVDQYVDVFEHLYSRRVQLSLCFAVLQFIPKCAFAIRSFMCELILAGVLAHDGPCAFLVYSLFTSHVFIGIILCADAVFIYACVQDLKATARGHLQTFADVGRFRTGAVRIRRR